MEKKYYIVNVPHVKHGYSIGVKTTADENDIIDLVKTKGLFEEDIDSQYAQVEDMDEDFDRPYFPEDSIVDLDD